MASELSAPPVLSTPAEYTFTDDPTSTAAAKRPTPSGDELFEVYEVARTAAEIHEKKWKRIALQFPDAMLADGPWVVDALTKELEKLGTGPNSSGEAAESTPAPASPRLYILADTSYSACCVDEIAAEHANADAVIHYGRACLSPTARLPVLHIFTRQKLDYEEVAQTFEKEFPQKDERVVIMADVMFQEHVVPVANLLREKGYQHIAATDIVRDPLGILPNRKLVRSDDAGPETDTDLKQYHLFHISTPPTALLLTLSSRLLSLRIFPTPASPYTKPDTSSIDPSSAASALRRRYALVVRMATASVIGILVNTLSVANYQTTISALRARVAAAGKKSYTIVVGKLNAAKLANFAEVDGWAVVGCWESGLVEQDGMWKPVITPFELDLALQSDEGRVWTGEWWGGIEGVKNLDGNGEAATSANEPKKTNEDSPENGDEEYDEDESEPPEFDLRTGKLISNSRPMRVPIRAAPAKTGENEGSSEANQSSGNGAVIKRAAGEVAMINGVVSPGAEYLRSKRTWQGLGSEFDAPDEEPSTLVEQGRSGIARGYTVGEDESRS